MPFTNCVIDGADHLLEYQKDNSDNTFSGLLHARSPILFSFSDSLFIPSINESHQNLIRNAIRMHEQPAEIRTGMQHLA
jgi:hypothetical protein